MQLLLLVKIFSANLGQGARKRVFLISHHLILRPLFVCPGKLTSIDASLKKKEALFSGIQTSRRCIPQSAIFSFFNPLLVKWI